MRARRSSSEVSGPGAESWSSAEAEVLALEPVPLDAQPTEYIRAAWADRPFGRVSEVNAAAAHDGKSLFVRLEWSAPDGANGEFPDAAAVFFPLDDGAQPATFGSDEHPVDLCYWQSNLDGGIGLVARGPGVFREREDAHVGASAARNDDHGSVVLACPIEGTLAEGGSTRVGVAVWDGANQERAGIGAVTPDWVQLEIEKEAG